MGQMTDIFPWRRVLLLLLAVLCVSGVSSPAAAYSGKIKETTRYQRSDRRYQAPAPVVIQYSPSAATAAAAGVFAYGQFATYVNVNGALYFSGINADGQFGNGSLAGSDNNQWWLGRTGVQAVATGELHTLVLNTNGSVVGAGDNQYGELGIGNYATPTKSFSTAMTNAGTPLQNIKQVAAGRHHSIALAQNGAIWVAGDNTYGELGIGATPKIDYWQQTASQWSGSKTPVAVAAGGDFSLAVLYDSAGNQYELWGTGRDDHGQLGLGNANQFQWVRLATNIMAPSPGAPTFAAGWWHTLYIDDNGALWGAGDNSCGQLGLSPSSITACGRDPLPGTAQNSPSFVSPESGGSMLPAGMYFSSVAAGPYTSFAILSNGDLYVSGDNSNGQLGTGGGAPQLGFVPVLDNVDGVAGGRYFSVAQRQGDVYYAGGVNISQSFAGQPWSPAWQLSN